MADRHCGAGEVLQLLGVMLVTEHVRRLAALQRRADPVGAGELLGVAEARQQLDAVKVPLEIVIGRQPGEHHAARVGEDDADRLALKTLAQAPQHRQGAAGQRGVEVGIADVDRSTWPAATFHRRERRHDARIVPRTWPGSIGCAARKRSLAPASPVSSVTLWPDDAPRDMPPPACHYCCRGGPAGPAWH